MLPSIKPKPSFDVLIIGSNADMNFMRCNTLIQSGCDVDYDWLPASGQHDFFYRLDCEFKISYTSWTNANHARFDGIITINNEYDATLYDGFGTDRLEIPVVRVLCSESQSSQEVLDLRYLKKFDLILLRERISLFLPLILLLHALTGKDYSKDFVEREKFLKDVYDNL